MGKHLAALARAVNCVWNFCGETQEAARRFSPYRPECVRRPARALSPIITRPRAAYRETLHRNRCDAPRQIGGSVKSRTSHARKYVPSPFGISFPMTLFAASDANASSPSRSETRLDMVRLLRNLMPVEQKIAPAVADLFKFCRGARIAFRSDGEVPRIALSISPLPTS